MFFTVLQTANAFRERKGILLTYRRYWGWGFSVRSDFLLPNAHKRQYYMTENTSFGGHVSEMKFDLTLKYSFYFLYSFIDKDKGPLIM